MVRPAGAAEDTALSNRIARGGGPRPHPDGQGRLACPNPAGSRNESGGADSRAKTYEDGPEPTFTPISSAALQLHQTGHSLRLRNFNRAQGLLCRTLLLLDFAATYQLFAMIFRFCFGN